MSLLGTLIATRPPRVPEAGAATMTEAIQALGPAWYHKLQGAASEVGPSLTLVNTPQTGVSTLAQDDAGGASTGLDGAAGTPSHFTGVNLSTAADLTVFMLLQPDALTAKHILLTTGGGSVDGQLSVENNMGAARAWSVVGGAARVIQSGAGVLPQGKAKALFYIRRSGAAPAQEIYVDDVQVASDGTVQTWAAAPASTWYLGAWPTLVNPCDGLVGHAAIFPRALTQAERQTLLRAQNVAWAVDIDAGSVPANGSIVVRVDQGGWHGCNPLTASAGNGALVTTTETANEIEIVAGGTTGNNDTFSYSFSDANGLTSPTRTVTVDVTAGVSEVTLASVAAFSVSRQRLTTLGGWPAGRTPKEIVTQGSRVHGYVRRGTDYAPNNDGTYLDIVAGHCKTLVNDTIVLRLDDDSTINLRIAVTHALPSPRIVLDRSGADTSGSRNYTDWATAVNSLQAGETLVVRAPTGTWNDSAGHAIPNYVYTCTTNPKPQGNTVTIMAHPDDVAAGRVPVIMRDANLYARFVYDAANSWQLHQTLSGGQGTIWRSVDTGFTIPGSYAGFYRRDGFPRLQAGDPDHTWVALFSARHSSQSDRLFVLQQTAYNPTSDWLANPTFRGPTITFESDGRIYVRLSPPPKNSYQDPTSAAPWPPWDWSAWYPDEDARNVPIFISTGPDNSSFTARNRLIDMEARSGWVIENLAMFYGTTAIYGQSMTGTGLILRGVYAVGGTSGDFNPSDTDATGGLPGFLTWNQIGTLSSDVIMDRCQLFGGDIPWGTWHDGKHDYGMQGIPVRRECVSGGGTRVLYRHCYLDSFWHHVWQSASPWPVNVKNHFAHCCMRRWGSDGAMISLDLGSLVIARSRGDLICPSGISGEGGSDNICQIVNSIVFTAAAWVGTRTSPALDIYAHPSSNDRRAPFWQPSRQIEHGSNTGAREFNAQSLFIGPSGTGNTEAFSSPRQGSGSGMTPEYMGWSQTAYANRVFNNIGVLVPTAYAWPVYAYGTAVAYYRTDGSPVYDFNHLWKKPGTYPAITGGINNYLVAGNSRTTPVGYATLAAMQAATSIEDNATDGDPLFEGNDPSYAAADPTAVGGAFDPANYRLAVGSPCRSGGGTGLGSHGITDYDLNTPVTYVGQAWRGPLVPDVPMVEQRLGILGPWLTDPLAGEA